VASKTKGELEQELEAAEVKIVELGRALTGERTRSDMLSNEIDSHRSSIRVMAETIRDLRFARSGSPDISEAAAMKSLIDAGFLHFIDTKIDDCREAETGRRLRTFRNRGRYAVVLARK